MYADRMIRPWFDTVVAQIEGAELFDTHTHVGGHDPDGSSLSMDELTAGLSLVGGRGVVFPLAEPNGYSAANDRVLAQAAASGGQLVAFCRVDPRDDPLREAERCLDAGARGIKLHPRAERFEITEPGVRAVYAVAGERGVPVLIHAGHGMAPLGRTLLEYCSEFPASRTILAHAGISDLSWLWRHVDDHPNLFFDTSLETTWWNVGDLLALFALVPPGRILFGSDAPYGTPLAAGTVTLRCGLHVGLSTEQLRAVAGGQAARLVAGEEPIDLGPAVGGGLLVSDPLLDLVTTGLTAALGRIKVGDSAEESLRLARLACQVEESGRRGEVCRSIVRLLDVHERYTAEHSADGTHVAGVHIILLAACLAATPNAPVPDEAAERAAAAPELAKPG